MNQDRLATGIDALIDQPCDLAETQGARGLEQAVQSVREAGVKARIPSARGGGHPPTQARTGGAEVGDMPAEVGEGLALAEVG